MRRVRPAEGWPSGKAGRHMTVAVAAEGPSRGEDAVKRYVEVPQNV